MNQAIKQSKMPPGFEESADNCQLRLLVIATRLKELVLTRAISQHQFRSREKQLAFLANKLAEVRATWATQSSINSYDPLFPMPVAKRCSPEELRICETYLTEKAGVLRKIAEDASKIMKWVKITVSGRSFPLRTNFYLSGLRAKISFVEAKLRDADVVGKFQNGFIEELEREELVPSNVKRPPLEVLREVFETLGKRNQRIFSLKKELRQETERVVWMERWLNFQELKMASYLPQIGLPDPVSLRALSKAALWENTKKIHSVPGGLWKAGKAKINGDRSSIDKDEELSVKISTERSGAASKPRPFPTPESTAQTR